MYREYQFHRTSVESPGQGLFKRMVEGWGGTELLQEQCLVFANPEEAWELVWKLEFGYTVALESEQGGDDFPLASP